MVEGLEAVYGPLLALPPWTFEAHHCTLGYQGLDLLKQRFPLNGIHYKGGGSSDSPKWWRASCELEAMA